MIVYLSFYLEGAYLFIPEKIVEIANAAEIFYFCIMDYPQINLQEWTKVGEGYNGEALVSPLHPGLLLKLVRSDMGSAEKVEQEFEASRIAFEAGIPTPRVYEIVRDGKDHGILSEKIEGKHSFARLCANTPAQIPQLAAQMADYGKQLHRMPILSSARVIPMKELLLTALSTSILVTDTQRAQLTALVKAMPDTGTVLHGDFQPGNIILADEKHYWIDLGWLSQGWYMMDLAHLYKMMVEDSVIPAVQELTHMTREQMLAFWDAFAKAYTGTEDVEALNRTLRPYAALDIIRTFYLHQNDNPQLLAFLRMRIGEELK